MRSGRPASALQAGIGDVVVTLIALDDAGQREAGGAPLAAEPVDVHVPDVEGGLAGDDPLRHHLADAARSGDAVGAEAGGDEQPADVGLAQAELVVGGERLRAVDEGAGRRSRP